MRATFKKLEDGGWGVIVEDSHPPARGQKIQVIKRDGTAKAVVIEDIIEEDSIHGSYICSIRERESQQTKSCWECGCSFTYAQCKARGGDWADSYCGC